MTRAGAADRERPVAVHRNADASSSHGPVLVTGGAGFIGCNLARRLLEAGQRVLIFDNLSRPGVDRNLRWLRQADGRGVMVEVADVRDPAAVRAAVARASAVYHFAAQVAVTTSLSDPLTDFEINARGTLNLLEALRALSDPPALVYTSTNKVYGTLADLRLVRCAGRYEPRERGIREHGIDEHRPLDFQSPYGCSKGTADQYVLDYARSFGLRAVVFRMSCIYGPRQWGTEDQGWVAHFLRCALERQPIVVYGDGRQVRDVLFIDDLVDALLLAREHIAVCSGRAFNIGGGPERTVSLRELLMMLSALTGGRPRVRFEAWRTGDQRYYVSDIRAFAAATGWRPRVSPEAGMERLAAWLARSSGLARTAAVKRPAAAANALRPADREGRLEELRSGGGPA